MMNVPVWYFALTLLACVVFVAYVILANFRNRRK